MTVEEVSGAKTPRTADEEDQTAGRRVWRLVYVLAALAVVGAAGVLLQDPRAVEPNVTWLVLLPCFALAEWVVIHLPSLRTSHSHTLREVPAIVGLAFLSPQQYVTVYVVGAVLGLLVFIRMRGVKLAFNLSLFTCEAVLGSVVYQAVLQGGDPISTRAWVAAGAAVVLTDLLSAAAVTTAISLSEGRFDASMWWEALRSGVVAAVINTCAALLLVTLIKASPSALPLLGVMLVLLTLAYRVFMRLARNAARTQLLYRFVGSTGSTGDADEVTHIVVRETAELLKADSAHLVLETTSRHGQAVDPSGQVTLHSCRDGQHADAAIDRGSLDGCWWVAALAGQPVRRTPTAERAETAASAEPGATPSTPRLLDEVRDGIAVPLELADGRLGALVVADHLFEEETFSGDDLTLLQTLAAHAAVALDKAQMLVRVTALAAERAHDALHDPLTGLPNRRAFNETLADLMRVDGDTGSAARAGGRTASIDGGVVLLLDIDDFKDVNDTLGHTAGDRLLQITGERLATSSGGFVARLGGDEFAVLLTGVDAERGVDHARALHTLLSAPIPLDEVDIVSTASIGVAVYSPGTIHADEVLAQADMAMYAAKADRSGVAVFRREDGSATARRLALAADLPGAIARNELTLSYQPQSHPATDEVAGFEALLRWQHPRYGAVPPPEIIAVAQRTGLLRRLTDHLLARALEARAAWSRAGHDVAVAVNVTAVDVCDASLTEHVRRLLHETGTAPERLTLEVTESDAMREPERALEVLHALAAGGVQLSVDDFGTGYSSLAYLDRLPVHEVKIDQSFVFRLERQAADSTIVRATVTLAHELGLRVVAEGVENELARTLVSELGCDLYQGYGLSRPMPEHEVLDWLARHEKHRLHRSHGTHLVAVRPVESA